MPKPKTKAKAKARATFTSKVRTLFQKPPTQYTAAYLAAYVAFFVAGFISSLIPLYRLFPQASSTASTSPDWIGYNLGMVAIESILPSLLFGAGFWLYGRSLIALKVAPLKPRALWFKSLLPAFLLFLLVTSTSLLSSLGFLYLSPNGQVIFDLATIPLLGLMYVLGWWAVRH